MSRAGTIDDRARIRRGTQPRKRVAQQRPRPAARKKQTQALALIPAPVKAWARRIAGWGSILLLVVAILWGFIAMRLPQMVGTEIGELIGDPGFTVRRVETSGITRMRREAIEDAAFSGEHAMPLVDLDAVRARILAIGRSGEEQGWAADARVSRRWPDTLVVSVTERVPAAIWQYQRQLMLVDAQGRPIERVRLTGVPLPDLPTVIGAGANRELTGLETLLASAPALKPVFDGATWMGNRRWDIRFKSGETLSLPEGDDAARAALAQFAKRDQEVALLGKGVIRIDMRVPGKIIFTVPHADGKPFGAAPAGAPAAPAPTARPASVPKDDGVVRNI